MDVDGDTAEEILRGAYRALCEHGYADLTLQRIAAETDASTAAIHYHYGSKADLFAAFLEFLYERYVDRIESVEDGPPRERLRSLVEVLLAAGEAGPDGEFRTAMLEARAQAPYDDAIRERLGRFDGSADPDLTDEFLAATIRGAQTRHVAVGAPTERTREAIERYVETRLVDAPGVAH